ncbi:MAG: flagellar hook-basal body protein [Dehalococcoidia bacterium]
MTTILGAAASGMVYHQQWMDTIGHNLANANSQAFKVSRALSEGTPTPDYKEGGQRLGVAKATFDPIFHVGAALRTDDPLHFAVQDDTFFRLRDFDGATVFTRVGGMTVDADGNLTGPRGRFVEPPITLPPGTKDVAIDQFGNISGIDESGAGRQVFGQLSFVRFLNPQGLDDMGDGLYRETVNSGPIEEGTPGSPGFSVLLSGAVEGSNVEIAEEFTSMIIAQRAYSASAKTFKIGDDMLALATNLTR